MSDFVFFVLLQLMIFTLPSPAFLSVLPKLALVYLIIWELPLQDFITPAEQRSGPLFVILMLSLIFTSIMLFVAGLFVWRSPLDRWADEQGLELVQTSERAFFRGPFFWRSSSQQRVYRIAVQDGPEQYRWGWVCLGGYLLGGFRREAEVRWEAAE